MRFGINNIEQLVEQTFNLIKNLEGKTISVDEVLMEMFKNGFLTSDIFFMFLGELKKRNLIESQKNLATFKKFENKEELEKIKSFIIRKTMKEKKVILTPWDVAKFYVCPRRLWLEKVTLSRELKKEKGINWDGEALHLAIKEALLGKEINEAVDYVLKQYEGKIVELKKEEMSNFISKLQELIKGGNFKYFFPERQVLSLEYKLFGIPDIITIDENNNVSIIEVKYGSIEGEVRKEHLIQLVGEVIVSSVFFRRKPIYGYLVYYKANKIAKVEIAKNEVKNFFNLSKKILLMFSRNTIPPLSRLPNFRKLICPNCHVKKACDQIEILNARNF
ncbi:MAG: hypothetical protein RMJ17_00190 [Candidatus Aenigmarchaeota archaeon]|nr:hypothetical protein [Candidatus Aenigmarchaeota archaeon]MDW8149010.1 hypothetical protein [Candidatus Aenigmarchaeota archaeon]